MIPRETDRFLHMRDSARMALSFASGRTFHDLEIDMMFQYAMVRAMEIIGEAASKVSGATQALYPDIPWPAIIGMRHKLIHDYYGVNLEILWKATNESLPELIKAIDAIGLTEEEPTS